jgi:hypothetical protein
MQKKVVFLSFSFEKHRSAEARLKRDFFAVSYNYNRIWMDFKEIIETTF